MIVPAAEARLVLTTAGSREEAERIARLLVEERLAACVNLVPGLTSIYRWQGEIETASEILLVIKTRAASIAPLEAALRRVHSYEVPEFLVLTPEAGAKPYLDWLTAETAPPR
ncbi:MAG: divalent-cation tolerance protein CutA [Acidobacteriota bacterium]